VASVTFFFWTWTMSRIVLFAIIFGIGLVAGILVGRPWRRRKKQAVVEKAPEAPASKLNG
jgi:uncharacterized integral membrane protein